MGGLQNWAHSELSHVRGYSMLVANGSNSVSHGLGREIQKYEKSDPSSSWMLKTSNEISRSLVCKCQLMLFVDLIVLCLTL